MHFCTALCVHESITILTELIHFRSYCNCLWIYFIVKHLTITCAFPQQWLESGCLRSPRRMESTTFLCPMVLCWRTETCVGSSTSACHSSLQPILSRGSRIITCTLRQSLISARLQEASLSQKSERRIRCEYYFLKLFRRT